MLSLGFVLPAGQRDILYLSALTASDVTCSGTSAPLNVIPVCRQTTTTLSGLPGHPHSRGHASGRGGALRNRFPRRHGQLMWVATAGTFSDTIPGSTLYSRSMDDLDRAERDRGAGPSIAQSTGRSGSPRASSTEALNLTRQYASVRGFAPSAGISLSTTVTVTGAPRPPSNAKA